MYNIDKKSILESMQPVFLQINEYSLSVSLLIHLNQYKYYSGMKIIFRLEEHSRHDRVRVKMVSRHDRVRVPNARILNMTRTGLEGVSWPDRVRVSMVYVLNMTGSESKGILGMT